MKFLIEKPWQFILMIARRKAGILYHINSLYWYDLLPWYLNLSIKKLILKLKLGQREKGFFFFFCFYVFFIHIFISFVKFNKKWRKTMIYPKFKPFFVVFFSFCNFKLVLKYIKYICFMCDFMLSFLPLLFINSMIIFLLL